jgi:protein-disulfide isomerase
MRLSVCRLLTALVACASMGASCQGAHGSSQLSSLPVTIRRSVESAGRALPCYHGCGQTVLGCLSTHPGCAHAARELELLTALARRGALTSDLIFEAQAYYRSFAAPPVAIDLAEAPCLGPADAKVTAVVYSDFECPACALARPALAALTTGSKPVRLCFKYFPLDSHPQSRQAAQAAEFARRQGRFWELHDQLFGAQDALSLDRIVALGAGVGLDADLLRTAVASDQFLELVNLSKALGKAAGVTATPTVFLNGHPFTLPLDGPFLSWAIEDHLEYLQGGWTRD